MNHEIKTCLYNAPGLRKKYDNIKNFMKQKEIDLVLITETWIKKNTQLTQKLLCPSICDKDCNRGMAGTGFIVNSVKNNMKFTEVSKDEEDGRFSIVESNNLVIVVCYLSPSMSLEEVQSTIELIFEKLRAKMNKKIVFAGDFNCKHASLNTTTTCPRGEFLFEFLSRRGFNLRNSIGNGEYTNIISGCQPTIIDLIWTENIDTTEKTRVINDVCLGNSSHPPVTLGL